MATRNGVSGTKRQTTDDCALERLSFGELTQGTHKRFKLKYEDTQKSNLKWSDVRQFDFEASAAVRSTWRSLISRATVTIKEDE